LAGAQLDDVADAVARGQLHQAQPVTQRVEAECFGIDGDAIAKAQIRRDIALMQFDLNGNGRAPLSPVGPLKDWDITPSQSLKTVNDIAHLSRADQNKSGKRRRGRSLRPKRIGAQERTRTSTTSRSLAPEASASTNSTTWAFQPGRSPEKQGGTRRATAGQV